MKKSLRSFINVNRTPLLLLGVVLGIAGFGVIAWSVGAQDGAKKSIWTVEEAATRAAITAARVAADEVTSNTTIDGGVTLDSPSAVFPANAGSLGAVPDCAPAPCTGGGNYTVATNPGLSVTFDVAGMTAPLTEVGLSATGSHTWVGDLRYTLTSPGGTASQIIFSHTGSTTPTGFGSLSDFGGPYFFSDTAPAAPTWWGAAATSPVPPGSYRASTPGGVVGGGANTTITPAFAGLNAAQINGQWTLRVQDGGAGDTGPITAASLTLLAGAGTPTPTNTPTSTPTSTPTNTPTATPTGTPAGTPTPTSTPTATPTGTPAGTPTPTSTPTATPTPPPPGACTAANTIIYGYNLDNDNLVRFTAATPGTYGSTVQLTGFNANEFIVGMDFRPATPGFIFAVTGVFGAGTPANRTVAVNTSGGPIVPIGSVAQTADSFFGVDFNPVPDRIRIVGNADTSRRLNPNNGTLAGTDTPLAYVAGDPGFGIDPNVVHVAYTNSQAGATLTTLYGIDSGRDTLVRIGGPDGTPSPNTGELTTIGPLGVDSASFGGFDIQPFTNIAYAALSTGPVGARIQRLYSINLATGAATLVGNIGNGTNIIDGFTIAPCSTAAGVLVSGRVLTPDGRGLRNAVVSMTDSSGVTRTVTTSTFGYYQFEDVSVGETFVMSVASRRYRFGPRAVQVLDSLSDVNFIGQE